MLVLNGVCESWKAEWQSEERGSTDYGVSSCVKGCMVKVI